MGIFVQCAVCDGGTQFVRVLEGETEDDAARRAGGVVKLWENEVENLEMEVGHTVDAEDVKDLLGLEF